MPGRLSATASALRAAASETRTCIHSALDSRGPAKAFTLSKPCGHQFALIRGARALHSRLLQMGV